MCSLVRLGRHTITAQCSFLTAAFPTQLILLLIPQEVLLLVPQEVLGGTLVNL